MDHTSWAMRRSRLKLLKQNEGFQNRHAGPHRNNDYWRCIGGLRLYRSGFPIAAGRSAGRIGLDHGGCRKPRRPPAYPEYAAALEMV